MHDITPSDMLTVEIGKGEQYSFYIKPVSYPSKLKIAFSITSTEEEPISFKVISHNFCI